MPDIDKLASAMHDAAIRYANGHTVDFQHEAREFLLESASQPGGGEIAALYAEGSAQLNDLHTTIKILANNVAKVPAFCEGTDHHSLMHLQAFRDWIAAPPAGNGGADKT